MDGALTALRRRGHCRDAPARRLMGEARRLRQAVAATAAQHPGLRLRKADPVADGDEERLHTAPRAQDAADQLALIDQVRPAAGVRLGRDLFAHQARLRAADGGQIEQNWAALSWNAAPGALSHDVYFGTDPSPDSGELQGNQTGTTFDPGSLAGKTNYYWRIDEVNAQGTTTGIVWTFKTK